jgi:vitamin K-dependent gamma-carboxylase
MQKTSYNNHYYLLALLSFFMALVPAHRFCSLDVKRRPDLQSDHCPNWCIWIFIVQIWIVYTYASIAKLYPDWLDGSAIASLLRTKTHYVLIGGLLGQKWFQLFLAYGGILFDLLIVPALLWKQTFQIALGLSAVFHLFNSIVFQIGVFPYMALALNVFFFDGETIRSYCFKRKSPGAPYGLPPCPARPLVVYGLALYFMLQILIPLRHHAIAGDVTWTEEGHRHAWRMMLRNKVGVIRMHAIDHASAQQWRINLRDFLTPKQVQKIATRPDMLWQFCQFLKAHFAQRGIPNVSLYATSMVQLNGHPYRPLYDNTFDLARVDWYHWRHNSWITLQRHPP